MADDLYGSPGHTLFRRIDHGYGQALGTPLRATSFRPVPCAMIECFPGP